ncbi:MAG TPA: hypothetical protein VMV86_01425 [Methanosarcinales archaeon]|nr:hypothetical protein [Methanosarcinales archaeon]
MDSKVLVTAKDGQVIAKSTNNAEFGHIRVEQVRMEIDDSTGFAKMKKISALIPGTIATLKGFGWSEGQEVDGKIRIVEKLIPFNKKDPERDYKIAGKSGVICCQDGQPIYRKHFFSFNPDLADIREAHDNDQDIKDAYAELESSDSAMEPNKDFDL